VCGVAINKNLQCFVTCTLILSTQRNGRQRDKSLLNEKQDLHNEVS